MRYREDKTTQAAAILLESEGGRMSYLKLIKLLYLADRKALLKLGRPISFDAYVAMKHGPVLSFTYDRITADPDPTEPSYWREFISSPKDYEVSLSKKPPKDKLSEAEEGVLREVIKEFGKMNKWALCDYTHELPEWEDPQGSSVPIPISHILLLEDWDEEDVNEVTEALEAEGAASRLWA